MIRKPDEIMAEYLLKGGKMLAKTCPDCSSPLFEYKGETLCVVCKEKKEHEQTKPQEPLQQSASGHQGDMLKDMATAARIAPLNEQFALTIGTLLERSRNEHDTRRLQEMMTAIKTAAEAYALISYGYGSRERS